MSTVPSRVSSINRVYVNKDNWAKGNRLRLTGRRVEDDGLGYIKGLGEFMMAFVRYHGFRTRGDLSISESRRATCLGT